MKNVIVFSLLSLLLQACTTTHSQPDNALSLRIYVFDCGQTEVRDLSVFAPGVAKGTHKTLGVSCYLIAHKNGLLLWDSGFSDDLAQFPEGVDLKGGLLHATVKTPFLEQLKAIGISPKDIKYAVFSHFHSDHVGNANAFTGSTLLIQREEYDAAFGVDPQKFGFDPKVYGELKKSNVIMLSGDYDVFKDGSVIIKRAIGHTPGHQALFVRLQHTGPILISGDLYHFTENRVLRRIPHFNFDKIESAHSIDTIENFVAKTNATMWIQHDYEQIHALKHAPLFYD